MVVRAALPSRFRRTRVLVVGCGDVGLRCVRALGGRVRVLALTSSPERVPELRQHGVLPLQGNLDAPQTLRRLAGLAQRVLHLAPPPSHSPGRVQRDERTRALIAALARRRVPIKLVYGSTTGVYGDCRGQWVDETRPLAPATPRAQRRVDAETRYKAKAFIDTAIYRGGDFTFVWVHKAIAGFGSALVFTVGTGIALAMLASAWSLVRAQRSLPGDGRS